MTTIFFATGTTQKLSDPFPSTSCYGDQFYFVTAQGVLLIFGVAFATWLIWDIQDAFYFKTELVIILVIAVPEFILTILSMGTHWLVYYNATSLMIGISIFSFFVVTIIYPLAIVLFNKRYLRFLMSRKDLSNSNSSENTKDPMIECLEDPVLLEAFKQFSVKTW